MVVNLQYYEEITFDIINDFYECQCEIMRREIIQVIIQSNDENIARLLIDIYPHITWRDTQAALLRGIGETKELRGVEFLIRFIRSSDDLSLVSQAILGLGYSQLSLAGEFLISLVQEQQGRLRQEALIGLSMMPHFGCDEALLTIIENEQNNLTLKQFAILCAGRRGLKASTESIMKIAKTDNGNLRNAAILALGHLVTPDQMCSLYNKHMPHGLFVDELMLYAADRIHHRNSQTIEEAVLEVLADSAANWFTSLRLLKEHSSDAVWEAVYHIDDQLDLEKECLLRASTLSDKRLVEDIEFLIKHQNQLPIEQASILLRHCLKQSDSAELMSRFSDTFTCSVLSRVKVDDILIFSDRFYQEENHALSIEYINAVVNQGLMNIKTDQKIERFLLLKLKEADERSLKQRLIRALSQLGCSDPSYLNEIKRALNKREEIPNLYHALSLINSESSTKIILARAEVLLKSKEIENLGKQTLEALKQEELYMILKGLSKVGHFEGADILSRLPSELHFTFRHYLIKILSNNSNVSFESLIEKTLVEGLYCDKLIAVNAVIMNNTLKLSRHLLEHLTTGDSAIRSKVIHALCLCGGPKQHFKLLQWFASEQFDESTAFKIFSTLTPKEGGNYNEVVDLIKQFLYERKGPFVNDSIVSEAIACLDTLIMNRHKKKESEDNKLIHQQDASLSKEIHAYSSYSETIKVILRNAELTWKHEELFNQLVDKSTMLVQYSKSVDLLLQAKLGYPLFHNPTHDLLAKLQSRIMALNLDDMKSQSDIIRQLGLEGYFTTKDFPAHRLQTLSESIMSGKIMVDRFRSIDGLRAWSLVLLLFGRTFSIGGQKYNALLPVQFSGEQGINQIVKLMNNLQDLRNSAAHHGILLEAEQLTKIRSDCFHLLNLLGNVLLAESE